MSGFGFGAANNPSAAGSSFLTGTNQNAASTGFNLGGNTSASGSLFGGAPTQPSGFTGFGAPASTSLTFGAAPTQTNTGLSFGSTLGQTSGISFGAPTTTASTGLFGSSFGAPASQSSGLTFGASAAQTTGLTFGQPAAQPAPAFGVPASLGQVTFGQPATSTSLSFGSTVPQASGISFGALAASTASTSLSFGAPTASVAPLVKPTTASTGFSFGSTTQTAVPSTGFSLGTTNPTTTSTGLTFGAATSTSGLGFGSVATTTASVGFQGLTTTAATTKPLTLFGSTTTTTASGLGLSLSTPATQSSGFGSLGGGTGLFGASKPLTLGLGQTSTSTGISFGTTPSSTPATTASVGLGGIDTTVNTIGQAGSGVSRAEKAVKESQIPNEITQTIDGFKAFVKSQKSFSSDIARGSMKPLDKVREDTESLRKVLAGISSGFQKNRVQSDRLKTDTAAAIRNAEMAQRTHDTPPGLQLDNVAPLRFFNDLVSQFENEMHTFRQEIENTEKHIGSLTEPRVLTPQELSLAMRRLHDSFVALAGRLQSVHNSVEMQKDQYMNLRKYFLKDTTSVFEDTKKPVTLIGRRSVPNRISLGPTPFSSLGNEGYGTPTTLASEPKSTFLTIGSTGWGAGQPQTNLTSSFLTSANNSLSTLPTFNPQEYQNLLLQKPPPGTKRGKH